jgi:hypothetical protein
MSGFLATLHYYLVRILLTPKWPSQTSQHRLIVVEQLGDTPVQRRATGRNLDPEK